MDTYHHDYYSTSLCFDSMLSYNTSVQNNIVMTTAKQNQKFPPHSLGRFAVEGEKRILVASQGRSETARDGVAEIFSRKLSVTEGGDARKMQGNFLVFAHASPRACPRRIPSHHSAIGVLKDCCLYSIASLLNKQGTYNAVSSHHALRACD